MSKITIGVRVQISLEDIENLLYSAAEGSAYWCSNSRELGYEHTVKHITEEGKDWICKDEEQGDKQVKFFVNLARIKKGLAVMAKKQPKSFADILNENTDMYTGDCLLQCALFGEVIYV